MEKRKNIWKAPQLSICIFALISAFTTGQGMTETFFDGNFICGIAISLGIQLLLVWLGWKSAKLFSKGDKVAKTLLIITYAFTILWSAGFSFVYVCNHVYSSFHMRDDQSVLTDTYRENITNLKEWADSDFNTNLQNITNSIGTLQKSASNISSDDGTQDVQLDFDTLKNYYKDNAEMLFVITTCEKVKSGKSISKATKIQNIIKKTLTTNKKQLSSIKSSIRAENRKINKANNKITTKASDKYNYKSGTSADDEAGKIIKEQNKIKQKANADILKLEAEKIQIQNINKMIKSLNSYISAKSTNAQGVLRTKFAKILSELGATSPNMTKVNQFADDIYEELTLSMQTDNDTTAYTTLLKDYLLLETALKTLENIRSVQIYCNDTDNEATISSTDGKVSSLPSQKEKREWQKEWNDTFAELKAKLYLLPSASKEHITDNYNYISSLQRSLLTELNGIEQAKYYLTNEHPFLAWLSLLLALFLDSIPVFLTIIRAHSQANVFEPAITAE